jgi:asparagine synthetase B (glutamine-hydrolysing)
MCGIFGAVSLSPSTNSKTLKTMFDYLAQLNIRRGQRGWGAVSMFDTVTSVIKNPSVYTTCKSFIKKTDLILGHTLAPTGGTTVNYETIHPFNSGRNLLAHNGILINHKQVMPGFDALVDSQYLLHSIQMHGVESVGNFSGQQACWLLDVPSKTFILWRVMSPLYISISNAMFIFSSTKDELRKWVLLPEGNCYQIIPKLLEAQENPTVLNSLKSFTYTSIYTGTRNEKIDINLEECTNDVFN